MAKKLLRFLVKKVETIDVLKNLGSSSNKNPYPCGRFKTQNPPKELGRYRIKKRLNGEIIYTGISVDLERRKKDHVRTGKLKEEKHVFEWDVPKKKKTKYEELRKQEQRDIAKHNPQKNINKGGGGRSPKKSKKGILGWSFYCEIQGSTLLIPNNIPNFIKAVNIHYLSCYATFYIMQHPLLGVLYIR